MARGDLPGEPLDRAWIEAREEALAGDASTRRYARLTASDGATIIRVDYPPGEADTMRRDLAVAAWLTRQGVPTARVLRADPDRGWALLDDLGRSDIEAHLRACPSDLRSGTLRACLGPLVTLAHLPLASLPDWNPPLDRVRLRWELAGFELWFLLDRCSLSPSPAVGRWLDDLADSVAAHPRRICHRDYHLNNLMPLEDGTVAVIDAQDLLVGPESYDVASLLEERAAPELLEATARQEIRTEWAARTGAAPGWAQRELEVRAQRGLKVMGTFARLDRAGRSGYERWLWPLAGPLANLIARLGAPLVLVEALLDCARNGGRHVR